MQRLGKVEAIRMVRRRMAWCERFPHSTLLDSSENDSSELLRNEYVFTSNVSL